jgi:mannosyltransferase
MIYFILFIAGVLRLIGAGQSLWLDEAAQALMSKSTILDLWTKNADFHPPLFHSLLHFWQIFGSSEIYMRFLPILFGVLSVYSLYMFAKKHFSLKIAEISAFLLAVSPFAIWYSQELRSYSLLVLLSILSAKFFYEKKWKILMVINVLGFFTNYMYLFVVLAELLFLVSQKEKRAIISFFKSQILLIFSFALFLPEFLIQVRAAIALTSTIPEWKKLSSPNFLIAIPEIIFKLVAGKVAISGNISIGIYAVIIIGTMVYILYKLAFKKTKEVKLIFSLVIVPLISTWIVSFFVPLNNPSRLIFILPFILLGVAYFIEHYNDKHLIYIFAVISFFGIFMQNFVVKNVREDWRGAVNYIQDKESTYSDKNKAIVLFEFAGPFAPWTWYSNGKVPAIGAFDGVATGKNFNPALAPALIDKKRVYLFEYFKDVTDSQGLTYKYLEQNGFHVVTFYSFNNLGFIYEFWKPSGS